MQWAKPQITIERDGAFAVLSSPTFVWGACLDVTGESDPADNAFDLLPGAAYRVAWPEDRPLPVVQRTGNL